MRSRFRPVAPGNLSFPAAYEYGRRISRKNALAAINGIETIKAQKQTMISALRQYQSKTIT
jgi:hypothetical protein